LSLIQIPKIEYITLEQFIPNWTEMIEEMDEKGIQNDESRGIIGQKRFDYAKFHGLNYEDTKSCLVGEGHHYNNGYADGFTDKRCMKCYNFCIHSASSALDNGGKIFQAFKLDLFTHMLEAHPQLMIK